MGHNLNLSDLSQKVKTKRSMLKLVLTFLLVLALAMVLFTPVDDSPFQGTGFYRETMARLDSIKGVLDNQPAGGGQIQIGWGQVNITPDTPVRLTGNHWKPYDAVYDSVYVRSLIFSNNHHKIALISYDLWIIHPHLTGAISKAIKTSGLGITGIYLTATHTHSSLGGWGSGLLGKLAIGGNDENTVHHLVQSTIKSLKIANAKAQASLIGYGAGQTQGMVTNRLDKEGLLDDTIRLLKMQNQNGEQAIFTTFSAHSVYMDKHLNTLSPDYPGSLVTNITQLDSINFACFGAGAMGSHSPIRTGPFVYENMVQYGRDLAGYVAEFEDQIPLRPATDLKFVRWPVTMRSPHFRITDHWRFRPWLFHAALGKNTAYISCLRIGNTVLLGLPVELSGEFYKDFKAVCKQRGISLMITSFNGAYLGYVNPEKYYYTIRKSETREMNWYGPQAGEYMVALVNEILAVI